MAMAKSPPWLGKVTLQLCKIISTK